MKNTEEKIDFTFGWLALKLLGKSLYSNAWSAISELVANGFDAKARKVYVYINNTCKNDAVIEIFDNGLGMDTNGMKTYAKVGFNKRETIKDVNDDYLVMGRKGIGKLAALYLSENYYLISKTNHSLEKWEMKYVENPNNEEEKPFLHKMDKNVDIVCQKQWEECVTGTLLHMEHVNLSGLGEVAYEALSRKLSNFFAIDSMGDRKIYLCVINKSSDKIDFKEMDKKIAFKNMAFINYTNDSSSKLNEIIESCAKNTIDFAYNKLNGQQVYKHNVVIEDFKGVENVEVSGTIKCVNLKGEEVEKHYKLVGWVGIHSTIDSKQAEKNDELFTRSKFYNPIQLRLYVRNKLAMENFLNVINNTQAFVNYIEGEIHFDILDEDDLPDIATSNRQGLDEHDGRVQKLIELVKKIINNLISKRVELNEKIKDTQEELLCKQQSNAKKRFIQEIDLEVDSFDNISKQEKTTLTTMISNKLKGEVVPKSDYLVFISHSSSDKILTDFIYHFLKFKGAKNEEFFYTSRDDDVEQYENIDSLAMQIKSNILKENVLLVYLTSKDYKLSEYCMFEGGAGWATRSVGEYISMATTYSEMPKFITNGKLEFAFENNKNIILDRKTYLFLIKMFNKIISHLNAGRRANAENEIPLIDESPLPTDIELNEQHKQLSDYMDKDVLKHWEFYVGNNIGKYIKMRYPDDSVSN